MWSMLPNTDQPRIPHSEYHYIPDWMQVQIGNFEAATRYLSVVGHFGYTLCSILNPPPPPRVDRGLSKS